MVYDWIGMYYEIMDYIHLIVLITYLALIFGALLGWATHSGGTTRKCILSIIVLSVIAGILGGYGFNIFPTDLIGDFWASLWSGFSLG